MSGVKRYIAQRGGLSPLDPPLCGTEVAVVLASDYDRLEQECERLKSIYEEDTRRLTGVNALADDLKSERDELRAQIEAMRGQVEGLKDVLAGAYAWMEDATSKVLYPIALHETGRAAMEAEGLGSCTPDLFKSIDAALQAKP